MRLTTPSERAEIRRVAEERTQALPDADLGVLGWSEWVDALERGLAAHHAGLLPAFKETVEELFRRGLVKMVFATETLALGVNMPARSVVLEKLVKWNGEQHVDLTPGEYTQLTGRAGRRGIDVEGHAVVLWSDGLQPDHVAGLASTRTYPLRSSFAPTYSMAVNLVDQVGREGARSILEMSFAQFQADRGVVGLARQVRKQEEALAGYAEAMHCHLGDFESYHRLRSRISAMEKDLSKRASADRRADAAATLERLRRGDVIDVPTGKQRGWAVVLDAGLHADGPRPTVLTADRQVRRLDPVLFPAAVQVVATVRVPKHFDAHDTKARRDLASSMRNALAEVGGGRVPVPERRRGTGDEGVTEPGELELVRLRRELRAHPCHGCADREDHARWAQRRDELERDHRSLQRKISGRTAVIARTFDRVCEVLDELGYLQGEELTPAGERLRFVYTQSDLLVAECLRTGIWEGLDGPALAAVVSTLVFEARREVEGVDPRLPGRGTARGVGGHGPAVVDADRPGGRAPRAADPGAGPRLRGPGVALGAGAAAGDGAARERPEPRRLRPVVPADPGPARPGAGLGRAGQRPAAGGRGRDRAGAPRRRRVLPRRGLVRLRTGAGRAGPGCRAVRRRGRAAARRGGRPGGRSPTARRTPRGRRRRPACRAATRRARRAGPARRPRSSPPPAP